MSRDFSKNLSNYMSLGNNVLGAALNGAAFVAFSAWVQYDTVTTTAGDNIIFVVVMQTTNNGLVVSIHNGTSAVLRIGARSVAGTDALQLKTGTTILSASTWYHIGCIIDIGGDTITPYVNGAAEGGGSVTFSNTTWTQQTPSAGRNDALGGAISGGTPLSTATQFDGRIAEACLWGGASSLTAGDMAALGAGVSPLTIRPDLIKGYWPLIGDASPERELFARREGTITGSVPQADHPRIYYGKGVSRGAFVPTVVGAQRIWQLCTVDDQSPAQVSGNIWELCTV